jgi:hypothetical protein
MLRQCFRVARTMLLAGILALLGPIAASGQSGAVPSNAIAKISGGGWVCKDGFRQAGDACRAIELPANAYLTAATYGKGWACRHGYRESAASCIAIALPDHAYLTGSTYGDGWKCARGYEETELRCVFVNVPENGFLSGGSRERAWECNRGYRPVGSSCEAIKFLRTAISPMRTMGRAGLVIAVIARRETLAS